MGTAEDYQVQFVSYNLFTGKEELLADQVFTATTMFATAYGREIARVRGRLRDPYTCGGTSGYCYTAWSQWLEIPFVPKETQDDVVPAHAPRADAQELRADLTALVDTMIRPLGVAYDAEAILDFIAMALIVAVGTFCVEAGRRQGATGLGVGLAAGAAAIMLVLAIRLVGMNEAWATMAMVGVMVGGGLSVVIGLRLGRA